MRDLTPFHGTLSGVGGIDITQYVRGRTTIMVALNEREVIDTEIVVLQWISAETEILIGDPALRALTQTFKKELRITYDVRSASAMIGTVQAKPIHTIEESDCIMDCYETAPGKFEWYFRWVWKKSVPEKNVGSIPAIYWKKWDKDMIRTLVKKWSSDVLEPCEEPLFAIPINPVPQDKVDHPVRITGDFKQFNKWILAEPTEETNEVCSEALMKIRRFESGTFVDLSEAYQSVRLCKSQRPYNAFLIDNAWFQSTRMLFGIAIGQKVLYKILESILPSGCVAYRDDIFIPAHIDVEGVTEILESNGFSIKKEKTYTLDSMTPGLFAEEKKFLGLQLHLLDGEVFWSRPKFLPVEVRTCSDLASALGSAAASHLPCIGPVRAEISILRSILGKYIGNDYRKYQYVIPNTFKELWILIESELKNSSKRYRWFLPPPDRYHLYTDASDSLMGGLIRASSNGVESDNIIDFCRRHDQLHINLRELDSIVFGLQELEKVAVKGSEVTLFCDSSSCKSWADIARHGWIIRTKAQNKSLIKNRVEIIRETLRINGWRLTVTWIPSIDNPADAYTRVRRDFKKVWKEFKEEDLSDDDPTTAEPQNTVFHVSEMSTQAPMTIAPNFEQPIEKRVEDLHRSHFHPGKEVLKRYISQLGWSVNNSLIDDVYARCVLCLRKRPAVPYINLKQTSPIPGRNWEWIQMDTLTVKGETKVIIAIDERTRFIEVQIIHGAPTAKETMALLTTLYHRYHLIEWHIRMDRGKEFYNSQVAAWVTEHGGTCHYSTVRRPTACGMVERVNRSLLNIMRIVRSMFPENTLKQVIDKSVQEYWTRPHKGLHGISPRQALYECRPISQTDLEDTSSIVISDTSDSGDDDDDGGPLPETPAENKQLRENTAPFWKEGQRVLIHEPTDDKLQLHWSPGTVVQNAGHNQAVKVKPDATEQGRQRAVTTVNQQWIASVPDPVETTDRIPQSEGTAPEGSVHETADAGIEQPETTHVQEREVTQAACTAESPRRSSRRNKPSKYLQEPYM